MERKADTARRLIYEARATLEVLGDFVEAFEMGPEGIDGAVARYHWSRLPGHFVDKVNGAPQVGATFTGTVREWYETLIEVIFDVCNVARRSHDLSNECMIVTSDDIGTIIESSVLFKPFGGTSGWTGTDGTISNRIRVKSIPQMPRNEIHLVQRPLMWREPSRLLAMITVLDMAA